MKETQCNRIVKYIQDFGSISTLEAFNELGCTRLASRICDLTKEGYEFNKTLKRRRTDTVKR